MIEDPVFEPLPSGRHGLPREVVERSQRARMLRAMLDAVAERGYAATSVGEVIRRATVSRPTFYEFWPDKEACFVEAYQALLEILIGRVAGTFGEAAAWPERIRLGLRELLHWLSAYPELARVAFVEALAAGPSGPQRYLESIARFTPFFAEGRRQAAHGDELPDTTETVVVGGLAAIVFDEIAAGRTEQLPQILPELVYAAVSPFMGHEQALAEMELAAREVEAAGGR